MKWMSMVRKTYCLFLENEYLHNLFINEWYSIGIMQKWLILKKIHDAFIKHNTTCEYVTYLCTSGLHVLFTEVFVKDIHKWVASKNSGLK